MVSLKLIKAFHWSIRYVIYGYPLPNVTWFKDVSPLVQNDVIYDRVTSRGDAVTKGALLFKMASHLNNGNYTLVASNAYGRNSQTIVAIFLQSPGLHLLRIIAIIIIIIIIRPIRHRRRRPRRPRHHHHHHYVYVYSPRRY